MMCSHPIETVHALDPETLTKEAAAVVEYIAGYYRNIENFPVLSQVEPGYLRRLLPSSMPIIPEPIDSILRDITDHILPGLTHWQSPNFYAYFQANASTAGLLGEMLCSCFNVVGFTWFSSPAATELESIVMDWMAKLLKLPPTFLFSSGLGGGGVIHGSTCEAVICTIAAARDRAITRTATIDQLVVYVSDQTHFTVQKSAKLVGIPPANLRVITTSAASGYALTGDIVHAAMELDLAKGLVPLYLCASVGTTGVGAVDKLQELGNVASQFGVWLHVDAAYAGSAAICPEFRHYLDGVELADSFSMNPHKWFLTNMDCCCLWIKNPNLLIDSLSTSAEFIKNLDSRGRKDVDYKDWQIALSRRFRAMKLWVVMRRFGAKELMKHIRSDVAMAEHFEKLVEMDRRFEVPVVRRFALVCFRLNPTWVGDEEEVDVMNQKLLRAVNEGGKAFMTHTVVSGCFVLRLAIGATLTELRHVEDTWKLIQIKAEQIDVARSQARPLERGRKHQLDFQRSFEVGGPSSAVAPVVDVDEPVRELVISEDGPFLPPPPLSDSYVPITTTSLALNHDRVSTSATAMTRKILEAQEICANWNGSYVAVNDEHRSLREKLARAEEVLASSRESERSAISRVAGIETKLESIQDEQEELAQKLGKSGTDLTKALGLARELDSRLEVCKDNMEWLRSALTVHAPLFPEAIRSSNITECLGSNDFMVGESKIADTMQEVHKENELDPL